MKILHTSDWHLGRTLYGRKRYEEFSKFLDWLYQTIEDENIDLLLVAGDVFDTTTPSNRAQELYYRFLVKVSASCCRHVVVIAGNHDSPSFLNAPKEMLKALNVYVVASVSNNLEDEVLVLYKDRVPEAIVCAVPYLRDKDIRTFEPGENIDDKNAKLVAGVKNHYEAVCNIAEQKRYELKNLTADKIPIIALGHLFTDGGKTVDGDGVRELYVGSLAHVCGDVFPSSIDYLALGHLHVPQVVGTSANIRYSGSPIPMGYGEASQQKQVVVVELNNNANLDIRKLSVPSFQKLIRITGSLDKISNKLNNLKRDKSSAWVEIEYTGSNVVDNLRDTIDEIATDSSMEILRIKNRQIERTITTADTNETLDNIDPEEVFVRCLDAFNIPVGEREELKLSYKEIINSLQEDDVNAE